MPSQHVLTALSVYNEADYVCDVLNEVSQYSKRTLVVDDGSTDKTSELLTARSDIQVITHQQNRGYGAALMTAFDHAIRDNFKFLVTIDCDGQHEPQRIPQFVEACKRTDIVSGSRYLQKFDADSQPPADRQRINQLVTAQLNRQLSLEITDAFCGFKAYRVAALQKLRLTETGYAMPLELWVQAAAQGLRIIEIPVPLIYLDEERSFGGTLDEGDVRLAYYRLVIDRSIAALEVGGGERRPRRLCREGTA